MNDKNLRATGTANVAHAHHPSQAFDIFVGFIYGMTIALVIETAYLQSHFQSVVSVAFTLLLLAFFAYDWLSRFSGRQAMAGMMVKARGTLLFRLILEIAIVYFLLIVCLRLVEKYSSLNMQTFRDLMNLPAGHTLSYAMAFFAICSGAWNALMIRISTQVNWPHIAALLKGHLHEDIVALFPFMKSWMAELAQKQNSKYDEAIEAAKSAANGKAHLAHMARLSRHLGWPLFLRQIVSKPHHLLLPYFFVFHVVALNFVLGAFIATSAGLMDGASLLARWPETRGVMMCLAPIVVVLAQVFLVCYFMSEKKKVWCEMLGCVFLALGILLSYCSCSAVVLIGLVIVQQVGANVIMTQYFDPAQPPQPAAEADAHVAAPVVRAT